MPLPPGGLRLSPAALATAALLLPGPLEHGPLSDALSAELADLEATGAAHHGQLQQWAAEQIMVVVAPDLIAEIAVVTAAGVSHSQIWARPDAAVIGRISSNGWVELAPVEPNAVASILQTTVGLVGHSEPDRPRLPIDPARLSRFEAALAGGDHPAANAVLDDAASSAEELATMAALASPHRRSWRVTTRWTSPAGPEHRWLSVLDAGEAGLWAAGGRTINDSENGMLRPASSAHVWAALVALLPPGLSGGRPLPPLVAAEHPGRAPCPTPSPPTLTASSDSSPPPGTGAPR